MVDPAGGLDQPVLPGFDPFTHEQLEGGFGSFGVLDSDREDVAYEDWRGHKLDRAMLDLLQAS